MVQLQKNLFFKLALLLVIGIAFTSCGRRGSLEAPVSPAVISVDDNGNEIKTQEAETVEDKPFILDGLL